MIREFGKPIDTAPVNTSALVNPTTPVVNTEPLTSLERSELAAEQAEPMRPYHVEVDEEASNNTAKIAGGVVVALLIIGGGIYAYETSRGTPAQQVALKTPAHNHAAIDQTAAAPPPAAAENNAMPTTPTPPATPAATPAPKPTHRVIKSADNDAAAVTEPKTAEAIVPRTDEAGRDQTADAGINAPMTLTPENAPPPEQSAKDAPAAQAAPATEAPVGQTAMQQPLTAPDVTGQTNQPAPAMANNDVAPQAPAIQAPLPAPALAAQTPAPQTVPAGQVPADQAQQPAAQ